ncbi:MAG TPA: CSLREA domain-containing protein, partial [Anaerolineaceae bacterium]|nr:CSLREA domain-containing protein [Anaerolineaceae bacterium]
MNAQARSSLQGFLALLVALTLTFSPSISIQPAAAQAGVEIPVTTTADVIADDSACSLREAVLAANSDSPVGGCPAGSGADTILLPAGTYTLALPGRTEDDGRTGDLDIHADLTLRGAGADLTVIDGARLDRILQVHAGQVLIAGLALTNGQAGEHSQEEREPGGAVHNAGTLTLEDVLVTRNFNENMLGYAGGLFNSGSLTLLRSRVVDNWTEHEGGGGGIWNEGELLVEDSLLDQNHSYT